MALATVSAIVVMFGVVTVPDRIVHVPAVLATYARTAVVARLAIVTE